MVKHVLEDDGTVIPCYPSSVAISSQTNSGGECDPAKTWLWLGNDMKTDLLQEMVANATIRPHRGFYRNRVQRCIAFHKIDLFHVTSYIGLMADNASHELARHVLYYVPRIRLEIGLKWAEGPWSQATCDRWLNLMIPEDRTWIETRLAR